MALWYHKQLSERLQNSPRRWLYRNHDRELNGTAFSAACIYLHQFVDEAACPEGYVVIRSDKNVLFMPAIVACGLQGYTYVPIAVDTPEERLAAIMATLGVKEFLDLAQLEELFFKESHNSESPSILAELVASSAQFPALQPLYILFTSGSTGTPKGVMISPENVEAFMTWAVAEYGFDDGDIILGQVPETFDLSVLDIYACLCCGSRVVGVEKKFGNDTPYLVSTLQENAITSIFTTPSLYNLLRLDRDFEDERFPQLRQILACGEVLPRKVAKVLVDRLPQAKIFNLYGPTETCVAVTSLHVTKNILEMEGSLPLGSPKGNMACVVLDEAGKQLPDGELGELVIIGDTVGLGYLGMPEKTAEVFIGYEGVTAYRTGDQGKIIDGEIHFIGRNDGQIKWSGYRIEIGEIESALNTISEVQEVVVVPRKLADGTVAALLAVIQSEIALDEQYIIGELSKKLPQYMLPSAYEFRAKLPLTPNGKIDRKSIG